MLQENIRKYRRAKGISQEEMAVRLHVVRQTVSKWENGLSVPDAEVLLRMAELLEVSVSQLLGVEEGPHAQDDLSQELARLNGQLAEKTRRERLLLQAGRKRGAILLLSFFALLVALTVEDGVVSLLLTLLCLFAAIAVLYRNLALLTSVTTDDLKLRALRITTLFDVVVLLVGGLTALLTALDVISLSEGGEQLLAMLLISCVMLFGGMISPRLPFNRHTGLRLPWTVLDEETWNVAHKTIGVISLPLVVFYWAFVWATHSFEVVTPWVMLLWIGVPGGISYLFFRKKLRGR